jgi:hypothetical protein
MALDPLRRLDTEAIEDGRDDVNRVVVLVPELTPGFHPGRPRDDAGVRRPTVELVALPHLERRVEGHRPPVRVVVISLRTAEIVEHSEVLLEIVVHPVEHLVLVDGAVRAALAARPVVRRENHDRVLTLPRGLEVVEESADVVIGVREEPRVHLGHPGEQPLLPLGQRVPRLGRVHDRERLPVGA